MKYLSLILASLFIIGGCSDELGIGPGSNAPPTLQFRNTQVLAVLGDATIQYYAADPDSTATISLFYDDDSLGFDGSLIVSGLREADRNWSYTWMIRGSLPDGLYFVYGIIDDGANPPVSEYMRFPLIVFSGSNIPPYVRVETPVGPQQGVVRITRDIWEVSGGLYNLYAEYQGGSRGGAGGWTRATITRSINFPGGRDWVNWESAIDEPTDSATDYQIRVWAENTTTGVTGPPHASGTFTLNN